MVKVIEKPAAKKGIKPAAKPAVEAAQDEEQEVAAAPETKVTKVAAKPKSGTPAKTKPSSFIKQGKEAANALADDEKAAAERAAMSDRIWRFNIPKTNLNTDFDITFLGGEIGDDGMLDVPVWSDHFLQWNGKWQNFVCIESQEPCPICQTGDDRMYRPSLVAAIPIIDHTAIVGKEDRIYRDRLKLYVCKRMTLQHLTKIATKKGGLTLKRFSVSRTNQREAAVGNNFDFEETFENMDALRKYIDDGRAAYEIEKLSEEEWAHMTTPVDFDEQLNYHSRAELLAMGFGGGLKTVGAGESAGDDALADEI